MKRALVTLQQNYDIMESTLTRVVEEMKVVTV
jgi:hypothetical protein